MKDDRHKIDATREPEKTPGKKAFLGIRDARAKAAIIVALLAVIALAAYKMYDRHVLEPRRQDKLISGDAAPERYARWQRKGPRGWEKLFEEASQSAPGYTVDTGRPARLKLVELGAQVADLAEQKLGSTKQTERLTAIYVLAEIGQPHERIARLLVNEVERAGVRTEAVAAMKCASAIHEDNALVEQVALAALESPLQGAREVAAGYLERLYRAKDASPAYREEIDALAASADTKARIELLLCRMDKDPLAAYSLLREMLDSDDPELVKIAVDHVGRLRDGDHLHDNTTPEELAELVERHRYYLNVAIAVARIDEDRLAALKALDEGMNTDDEAMVRAVANLVAELRDADSISDNLNVEKKKEQIAENRAWVEKQLKAISGDADEGADSQDGSGIGAGTAETGSEVDSAESSAVEETPSAGEEEADTTGAGSDAGDPTDSDEP